MSITVAIGLASLSRGQYLPVFVVRKAQRDYGARDLIVEPYAGEAGDPSAEGPLITTGRLVEDAITRGGSVQKAIEPDENNWRTDVVLPVR